MFDLIIRNARVADGSLEPPFYADIGIQGENIVEVGELASAQSESTIDGSGLVAAPGFIDMHTHSDRTLLINPKAESKIRQGVTTEVTGMCGSSPAPILPERREEFLAGMSAVARDSLSWDWSTFGEFLDELRSGGTSVNVFPVVGHGTLRVMAMRYEARPPKPEELETMSRLLAQSLDQGARGMSTGLIYPPGCYSETGELIDLAQLLGKRQALYFSHIRGEGRTAFAALEEAIEIGRRADVSVELAHHKMAGRRNWWKEEASLLLVERARREGVDIAYDMYPYLAGSTSLRTVLPDWVHEGGVPQLLARLRDPAILERLRKEIERDGLRTDVRWEDVLIACAPAREDWEGKTVAELAEEASKDPFDTLVDILLVTEADVSSIHFQISEENLRLALSRPWMTIGSDGSSLAPYGVLGKGRNHPRNYGAFPRILGHYVREEMVLRLEEAVHKMTGLPAQKLGLTDRGYLRRGMKADVVLFHPDRVIDKATFMDPYQYPEGIEYVLVNGQVVTQQGEHTGALPGQVLTR